MDSVIIDDQIYLVGGDSLGHTKMYSAQWTSNALFQGGQCGCTRSTLGLADGSVTLGQLAPDALAKIGLDHNPQPRKPSPVLSITPSTNPLAVVWYGKKRTGSVASCICGG